MAQPLSSVDDLLARAAALAAAAPEDVARVAVFDADHTLWNGDIGDTAFAAAASAGLVAPSTWRGPVQQWAREWGLQLPDDADAGIPALVAAVVDGTLQARATAKGVGPYGWKPSLYALQAWIYAGHRRDDVVAFGERLFAAGFAARIWQDMRAVVDGLQRCGLQVHIASASHGALVAPGAARLRLPAPQVHGMEPVLDDDGLGLPALQQDTYGPGKATTVRAALQGRRPLLAFGDAVLSTDKELLALAWQGVAVAPQGAHREAAHADDALWLFDPAG